MPPSPTFDLNGFLPYQLDAVASRLSEALLEVYGDRHDLRVPDWRVLVWLDHSPDLAAKDIAVRARMDKATVSRALTRLESRDLIARSVAADDQRSQALQLTRKGKALLGKLLPRVQQWEASLLAPFSATEQRQLRELLGRLEEHLDGAAAPEGRRTDRAASATTASKVKASGRTARPAASPAQKPPKGTLRTSKRTSRGAPEAAKVSRAPKAKAAAKKQTGRTKRTR